MKSQQLLTMNFSDSEKRFPEPAKYIEETGTSGDK
jgi:hypothetical protein